MNRVARVVVLGLSMLAAACATPKSAPATPLTPVQLDDGYKKVVVDRAVFELGCPAEQITATFLGDVTSAGVMTSDRVIGLTACGKQLVYVARCTMSTVDSVNIISQRCVAIFNSAIAAAPPTANSDKTFQR